MPVRVVRQDPEIRGLFRQRIREKLAREKTQMRERIDESAPSWLAWALKPVAGMLFDGRRHHDGERGRGGENSAGMGLWFWLSKEWIEMDDVVIEPKPEKFAQIDHVLIGPPGVCLVETKNWDGAFKAYRDRWWRKDGNRWVDCGSPIKQNTEHLKLFAEWTRAPEDGRGRLAGIDRRIIYLLGAGIVLLTSFVPLGLPLAVSEQVESLVGNIGFVASQRGDRPRGRSPVNL